MKKILYVFFVLALAVSVNAESVFDSMDTAKEIQFAPSTKTMPVAKPAALNAVQEAKVVETQTNEATTTVARPMSLKEEKFNNALVNLDDAQVELRQELAALNAKYSEAVGEKERIVNVCANLKREIKDINTKMKNVEKSKKIINKNITAQ